MVVAVTDSLGLDDCVEVPVVLAVNVIVGVSDAGGGTAKLAM